LSRLDGYDKWKVFKQLDLVNDNVWLAGGALRGIFNPHETIEDFDLFFRSAVNKAETAIKLEQNQYETVFVCPQGKLQTMKNEAGIKIQLISENYYNSMEQVIENFDINAARIVWDGLQIHTTVQAAYDCKSEQITLWKTTFPNATFRRIIKYNNKGFSIPSETIDKFVRSMYNAGVNNLFLEDGAWRFYID
jgi:hypothetical protein